MSGTTAEFAMSTSSLHSNGSQNEDWDRSESEIQTENHESSNTNKPTTTPRNSVIFPAEGIERTPIRGVAPRCGRTLSELMKLHAEKGTEGKFSQEEASRVAEVLGQWINSESSPYEAEDDFFTRSQDDLAAKRSPNSLFDANGRPRGQSESFVNSRPASAADFIKT